MPDLDLDTIVTKVHDILAADSKTKAVNWQKGRFTPHNLRTFPAGGVSFGQGTNLERVTAPSGWGGPVVVRIMLWTARHEGIAEAEATIGDLIGKVADVLTDVANVALDIASYPTKPWITSIATQEIISNIETAPVHAEATLLAVYTIRKQKS